MDSYLISFLKPQLPLQLGYLALHSKDSQKMDQNKPASKVHLRFIDLFLRLSVIPLSIASIWLTATNKQDSIIYGRLEFSNLSGLKYMVWINAISVGYSLVAIVSSWFKCLLTKAWFFLFSDQVLSYLMVTSTAAVVELLYLVYNGDKDVSWSEACSSFGSFCNRVKMALVLHAIALLCFLGLSLISAYRVFSKFGPPCVTSEEVERETN
ncbi:CASP-like protein 2D1 isoform X1 [Macadamia integrifolia]|uniref:CASP-like protein 2D1 isoform X1 n=1 Tax=Macadamia integrifolia TaxID=60698 RepID=UPI001C53238B|nr:CASP-like protein 2D1 isoform X1 [Macadamia integrifolia]